MVHTVTLSSVETPDGTNTTFTFVVGASLEPLRRGGFRAISNRDGMQNQIIQDDGVGGTLAGSDGTITTTLNYTTSLATPQSVTFTTAPLMGDVVTLQMDIHQGFPVMGVMNFFTQLNTKELIVADTTYINRFNTITNRLDDISPATLLTGNKTNFMSWTNYPTPQNLQRLLFVNFKDPVQRYDGTSITPYPIYTTEGTPLTGIAFGTGDGTVGPYDFTTLANTGVLPGEPSATITDGTQVVTVDQFGVVGGAGSGTVDLLTGTFSITFNAVVTTGTAITISYTPLENPILTALHISQFKERLIVEYIVEGSGTQLGHRIRISGLGAMGDTFTTSAIGAGIIDVPSEQFLSSSDFNRDDRLLFTKGESWSLKYTNNDIVPFSLNRIDQTRGSEAPYGTITYLNVTNAVSRLGFILSDGYSIERSDDKLPDYSFNNIDQNNFNLCFAGSVDKDRDHYLIYPSPGQIISDQILITNYEEQNYSVYRLPLSCMGNYILTFNTTWNDLMQYTSWDEMATIYGNWNSFAYSKGAPISIGGGHRGEITMLNNTETEDYPVMIRGMTIIDAGTLQLQTDFQTYAIGDTIAIEGNQGIFQVNNKQAAITQVIDNYTFNLAMTTTPFINATYTSGNGGVASKCIEFDCKTKKFNPFSNLDKKVTCGWMYFYVSTTGTDLTVNRYIANILVNSDNIVEMTVPGHGYKSNQQIYMNAIEGAVELNNTFANIFVTGVDTFILLGVDGSTISAYTIGGFTSVPEDAILQIQCITNDNEESTSIYPYNPTPYQVNMSSQVSGNGIKK